MGFEERDKRRKKGVVAQLSGAAEPEQQAAAVPGVTLKAKESRSKRMQVVVKPSVHAAAQAKAAAAGVSLNEVINQILENWVTE